MAQHKIESRIERVLRNPKSGSGVLQIAGWVMLLLVATPVIYSAAALQVASERAPAAIPANSTVLTTMTSLQPATLQSTSGPKPTQQSAQSTLARAVAEPRSQDAELKKALEQELEIAKIRQGTQVDLVGAELRKLNEDLAQNFRSRTQEDLLTLESKMRQAEAETEALKSRLGQSTTTPESAQSAHPRLLQLQAVQRELAARLAQAQAAAAGQDQSVRQGQTVPPSVDEYRIKPGDVLSVFVFKYSELSRERVTVQPDGRVSTPLVQSIPASGLTPAELKVEIQKRLKEVIDTPNVTVILESK